MQGLIDLQNEKLATLQAEQDFKALQHQDESTGQGQLYIHVAVAA